MYTHTTFHTTYEEKDPTITVTRQHDDLAIKVSVSTGSAAVSITSTERRLQAIADAITMFFNAEDRAKEQAAEAAAFQAGNIVPYGTGDLLSAEELADYKARTELLAAQQPLKEVL